MPGPHCQRNCIPSSIDLERIPLAIMIIHLHHIGSRICDAPLSGAKPTSSGERRPPKPRHHVGRVLVCLAWVLLNDPFDPFRGVVLYVGVGQKYSPEGYGLQVFVLLVHLPGQPIWGLSYF